MIKPPFTLFEEQIEFGFRYEGHLLHVTALTASMPVLEAMYLDGGIARRSHIPGCGPWRSFDNHLLRVATAIPATIRPYQTKL